MPWAFRHHRRRHHQQVDLAPYHNGSAESQNHLQLHLRHLWDLHLEGAVQVVEVL